MLLMFGHPLVFVDIDTQRDFLDPAGALYVPGSTAIVPRLALLTDFARTHGIPILATACAHELGDPELEVFPPHCMIGTPGQERIDATARSGGAVLGRDEVFDGAVPLHLTIQKRVYDVFSHPDAGRIVGMYSRHRPTFVVYGVATDYCVKAAAEGLLSRSCRVAIVADAIRAIDTAAEGAVLTGLVAQGATLVLTEAVCRDDSRQES
jgi:nicotinamidase/pyrazinamidase